MLTKQCTRQARDCGVREHKERLVAYQATVIPVMIASPGDVSEEREAIRTIIHDWNDVNGAASSVMLASVGWETHSSPELGTRPQELINKRVLKDCDLLVGVFWTRLGTPTGKSASGTVEEIEEHVAAGKPAMIYFSSQPVAPESIDPEQYAKVKEIREKWKQQGLIETYENIADFNKKFSKQLQLCLVKNEYLSGLIDSYSTVRSIDAGVGTHTLRYELSEEARTLIKAAASDGSGEILKLSMLAGQTIQAGGQAFGKGRGRESAKWEGALQELESAGLVVGRGYKGEFYELTREGWEIADAL